MGNNGDGAPEIVLTALEATPEEQLQHLRSFLNLAQANFASYLAEEITDAGLVARALAGWNKLLTMHLQLMSDGCRAARAVDEGDFEVSVAFYGRLREIAGRDAMVLHLAEGSRTRQLL
jgi:hypothetical protein